MHTLTGPKPKQLFASRRLVPIMAAGTKAVPTQIELVKAGAWPASSVKGPLTITIGDLHEMANNFAAGIGLPGNGMVGLPIDFSHEEWNQAAGWINSLEVVGDTLMGNVTWTTEGEEVLTGGMFKCISPSFYPACIGEWADPENADITARNVLVGAGLTNIPFFKNLSPIMASNTSEGGKSKNVIYINADERKNMPTLDEIRVKDAASLTDEEKAFVVEHKAELSEAELTKFELAEAPVVKDESVIVKVLENTDVTEVTPEVQEAVALQASVKSGDKVVMAAADIKAMNDKIDAATKQLETYRRNEVRASVTKHIDRGAIKSDQLDTWTDRIMADATMEDLLKGLSDNKIVASEIGSDNASDVSAQKQLSDVAEKIMADRKVSYGAALIAASNENPDLVKAAEAEKQNN